MSSSKPKQKYNYFKKGQKRVKYSLEPNLKGFLCSCNNREKECVKESYNILNRYADTLFGSEDAKEPPTVDEDIEDELVNELDNLKSQSNEPKSRRFQVVESGAKNFLFIRTTLEDPIKLAETIVSDIAENKQQLTRFLIRLVPIEVTCKAYIKDIENSIEPLLTKHFKEKSQSFSIVFNHRNNNSLSKDEVIKVVADKVSAIRADHKVNLKEAEVSIVIEVIRNMALIGVVPNFLKYKKYNLHMLCDDSSANIPIKGDEENTNMKQDVDALSGDEKE